MKQSHNQHLAGMGSTTTTRGSMARGTRQRVARQDYDSKGRHGGTTTARGYSLTKVTKIRRWLRLACGVHGLTAATATKDSCFMGDGGGASKMAKDG
jgi:hypothetical protein